MKHTITCINSWDSFVRNHPEGNIFQSETMCRFFQTIPGYSAVALGISVEKELKGVVVIVFIQAHGWKEKLTKRAIITGGPLIDPYSEALLPALMKACEKTTRNAGAVYTELRPLDRSYESKQPFPFGSHYIPHLNLLNNLLLNEQELFRGMHKKKRSNIRRAEKKGVRMEILETPQQIETTAQLFLATYNRINIPAPPAELFTTASEKLREKVLFLGAYYKQKLIACRMYLLWERTVYDWYAGSDETHFPLCANDLLPWEAMKYFKRQGYATYNFMGAGQPGVPYGVREHKLRFGGNLIPSGRIRIIHKPLLFRAGNIGLKLYKYIKRL